MRTFGLIRIILILLLSVYIVGVSSGDEVIPGMSKGTFMGNWHPSGMCDQCHATLIPREQVPGILGSCKCHRAEYTHGGKIDIGKIDEVHGIKTCTRCHIGSVAGKSPITYDTIHNVHAQVECTSCHGDKASIMTPEDKKCDLCHIEGVHFVHGQKTEDLCIKCHGTASKKYLEEDVSVEDIFVINNETTIIPKRSYPTILNLLKNLIDTLFG